MEKWYIYLHEWLLLMVQYGKLVGKYTSSMDGIGFCRIHFVGIELDAKMFAG